MIITIDTELMTASELALLSKMTCVNRIACTDALVALTGPDHARRLQAVALRALDEVVYADGALQPETTS